MLILNGLCFVTMLRLVSDHKSTFGIIADQHTYIHENGYMCVALVTANKYCDNEYSTVLRCPLGFKLPISPLPLRCSLSPCD